MGFCCMNTGCQLSSGTPFTPHFSRMALISIDCYTLFERYIPTLQNELLFVLKTSLVFAQQLISYSGLKLNAPLVVFQNFNTM